MELSIVRNHNNLLKEELNNALRRMSELTTQVDAYKQQLSKEFNDSSTQTDESSLSIDEQEPELEAQENTGDDPNEDTRSQVSEAISSYVPPKQDYKPLVEARELYIEEGCQLPAFEEREDKFFINPNTAIPHHDKGQNLKIAIIHDNKITKLLLHRDTTCAELHERVRSMSIRELEYVEGIRRYNLIFPRYTIIPDDNSTLWSTGMRYFPSYIWRCPYEFETGDLMEVQFGCKGPRVNGDPSMIHPDAYARRNRASRGD